MEERKEVELHIEKYLSQVEAVHRENSISHLAYEREMAFFQSIKEGNIEETRRLFKPLGDETMGVLSNDNLRNLKYHLIITVALLTRYCIEGGMEMEIAYNLSDIFIRNIDICKNPEEVKSLHLKIVEDYAERMHTICTTNVYPKSIMVCIDYIYNHLHDKINLEDLAAEVSLSPSYLSRLFHREVGMTVKDYLLGKRIEAAQNMLQYSDLSCMEIAVYLCFSSESHFIRVFRERTGYTPKKYRQKYFRSHWGRNI